MSLVDTIDQINSIAAKNKRTVNAYKSRISNNMNEADDLDELESKFDSQINQLKNAVDRNTRHINDIVRSKYPQSHDPNYEYKRKRYNTLMRHASAQINNMEYEFDNAFSYLNKVFRRLRDWIRYKVKHVYTASKGFFNQVSKEIGKWFS